MIFTFYSFKGGVGRSMALASIAELLFKRGLRVRMVDFDLEAPGLERYFDYKGVLTPLVSMQEHRGVIDMLESYCQLTDLPSDASETRAPQGEDKENEIDRRIDALLTEPIDRFLVPIYKGSGGSYLSLLPAGRRLGGQFKEYASRVLAFDWNKFFEQLDGELFFEWFRREISNDADVVLIDSRTGVTEMTGVSTFHLSDAVVSVVAPNHQNLEGLVQMAISLSSDAVRRARRGRPAVQMFVPSRVSLDDEAQLNRFKHAYETQLGPFFPKILNFDADTFHTLKILHVPTFSYTERVAGREHGSAIDADLVRAYDAIARAMAQLADPAHALYASFHARAEVMARRADDLFESMPPEEQQLFRQLATRLVRVGGPGERSVARQMALSGEDVAPFENVLRQASAQEVLRVESKDQAVRVTWIDDDTPDHWSVLQKWIAEDLFFLGWRQNLQERMATWSSDPKEANLLIGTQLALGTKWAEDRPRDLLASERAFIARSVESEQQRLTADPAAHVRRLESSRLEADSYITEQYAAASASTNRAAVWATVMFWSLLAAWLLGIEPVVANARVRAASGASIDKVQKLGVKLERIEAASQERSPRAAPPRELRQLSPRQLRSTIDWTRAFAEEHTTVALGPFGVSPRAAVALTTGLGSSFCFALIALFVLQRGRLTALLRPAYDRLAGIGTPQDDPMAQKWRPLLERMSDTLGRPLFRPSHRILASAALGVVALIYFRISFLALPLWSYSWPFKILLVWILWQALAAVGLFVMYVFDVQSWERTPGSSVPQVQ